MKLVIYRDKQTNKIVSYHEVNIYCTEEELQKYNNNKNKLSKAEIVELNEIAEYFYNLKTRSLKEEAEDLRELKEDLERLVDRIDNRLYEFDSWLKKKMGE